MPRSNCLGAISHKRDTIAALIRQDKPTLANAVAWGGRSLFDPTTVAAPMPKSKEIEDLVKLFARKKALDKPGVAQKLRLRTWKEFQRFYDRMATKYKDFDMSSKKFWGELEKRATRIQVQPA